MSNTDNAAQPAEPAFPRNYASDGHNGMSLRDYFAGEALPICYSESCKEMEKTGYVMDWRLGVAQDAYKMADAMLAARALGDVGV